MRGWVGSRILLPVITITITTTIADDGAKLFFRASLLRRKQRLKTRLRSWLLWLREPQGRFQFTQRTKLRLLHVLAPMHDPNLPQTSAWSLPSVVRGC